MRDQASLTHLAERLMLQPAAPYHEAGVIHEVEAICGEHNLKARRDRWGNVFVSLTNRPGPRPLVLAAHMDHPGFARFRRESEGHFTADFLGGVPASYFQEGIRLRLQPGDIPARLGKVGTAGKRYSILAPTAGDDLPAFGVWDLPAFDVRRDQIHGRSCDDLIGVATILATLIELKQSRSRAHVIGVISRAEEVGFQGALMVAASGAIPRDALVISLETSRELPPVKIGQGVILRVGDRTSVFDPEAMRFLAGVAQNEVAQAEGQGEFKFQRALMSGGTCEGTAYQAAGFQTAAVCVALGNYHNCAPNGRIAAEFVSRSDARSMAQLMVAAARQMTGYQKIIQRLPASLAKLARTAKKELA